MPFPSIQLAGMSITIQIKRKIQASSTYHTKRLEPMMLPSLLLVLVMKVVVDKLRREGMLLMAGFGSRSAVG